MSNLIQLKRLDQGVGELRGYETTFDVPSFDLYGRCHDVKEACAAVAVTRLTGGLHLDLNVVCVVETTCDRTLEPLELRLEFGDSELLGGPNDRDLAVQDWTLDLSQYAERALLSEVPMQVFKPGTEPVGSRKDEEEIDPRWRGLGDLFASGF